MNSVMKRTTACLFAIMMVPVMAGCGGKVESTEEAAKVEASVQAVQEESTEEKNIEEKESAEAVDQGKAEEADQSQEALETGAAGDVSNVVIDYGTSEVYTQEDMDEAIAAIEKEFSSWEGCELKEISFTDDEKCSDNLSYINSLGMDTKYDECIVFTSKFHSPVEGGGAWEADMDYENWDWYLGRTNGGNWELLTWGY